MSRSRIVRVCAVLSVAGFLSACDDSTGPGDVDANGALQSLSLAFLGGQPGSLTTPDLTTAFSGIASRLGTADVTIGGVSRTMFALGIRQTFPEGTCIETIFVDPAFPPPEGECTSPSLGMVMVMWQSHSAREAPDRMLLVIADEGTADFAFDIDNPETLELPALALYVEGQDDIWASLSGTLTSNISSLNQSCNTPLPPYAKTGSCSFASFDEQGEIVFEPFDFSGAPSTERLTISIPRQTILGMWQTVTEVKPITFALAGNRLVPSFRQRRLNAGAVVGRAR